MKDYIDFLKEKMAKAITRDLMYRLTNSPLHSIRT